MHPTTFSSRRRTTALTQFADEQLSPLRSPDDRLTDHEVAEQYNLKRKTLQQWRWLKRGPPFQRAESKILYRRGDVEAWLARK